MQYYAPPDGKHFVGDCMPFFHEGTFRLFYLIDEDHHRSLGGLGGHQWAQTNSTDLVHWEHHPLAIPIEAEWEGSICTGSTLFHDGTYYGFYATRKRDYTQHLSVATSRDGVHFEKRQPNPFASPPAGYSPNHYRDPVVFCDETTGIFHMLVTAWLEDYPVPDRGGCLAHLISTDLDRWEIRDPFIIPGLPGAPECPDYFYWRGWYYLIFSNHGVACYRMSREPFGPWICPAVDTFDGGAAHVMKTAAFTGDRRIGVAWLASRVDDKDDGAFVFGGNAVFRELLQHPDGSLGTRFPTEMMPHAGSAASPTLVALTPGVKCVAGSVQFAVPAGLAAAVVEPAPLDFRLHARVLPGSGTGVFGLRLRAGDGIDTGYDLQVSPNDRTVRVHRQSLQRVDGLDQPFELDLIVKGSLIDVCIDQRRCLIDRCPEQRGERLWFYALNCATVFEAITIAPLA